MRVAALLDDLYGAWYKEEFGGSPPFRTDHMTQLHPDRSGIRHAQLRRLLSREARAVGYMRHMVRHAVGEEENRRKARTALNAQLGQVEREFERAVRATAQNLQGTLSITGLTNLTNTWLAEVQAPT